jgi:hypothetical protein
MVPFGQRVLWYTAPGALPDHQPFISIMFAAVKSV